MLSSCTHACHCAPTTSQTSQPEMQEQRFASQGEWIWSTSEGFASHSSYSPAEATHATDFLAFSTCPATTSLTQSPAALTAAGKARGSEASEVSAWLPQNETAEGLWGASAFVDMDLLPAGMAIDLDINVNSLAFLDGTSDLVTTPSAERQDSLPTPGLIHSPASARTFEALPNVGAFGAANTVSSAGSTPSVPATPTSLSLLEPEPASMAFASFGEQNKLADYHEMAFGSAATAPPAQGLASAFDFTNFPHTHTVKSNMDAAEQAGGSMPSIASGSSQGLRGCVCSASLSRTSTSTSQMAMPTQMPIPAPGWLDPEVAPVDTFTALSFAAPAPARPSVFQYSEWPDVGAGGLMTPASCSSIGARYEPYRNPSVASTASTSSQGLFATDERISSRRRSLTVGSLPSAPSGVVDRVRMLSASRAPSPGVQLSLPASPRLSPSKKFSSMPCRRARVATSSIPSLFSAEAGESSSLKDRRMASLSARGKANPAKSSLTNLFAARDALFIDPPESSPALSEFSLSLDTPTSATFSPPCTPTMASCGPRPGQEGETEDGGRAKIAMHHHRTKLQRAVLNDVVTSLQRVHRQGRRQYAPDWAQGEVSVLAGELHGLELHEAASDAPSSASLVVAGETREMRKNRQKAESKMRMRRKEIHQFAALTRYAQLAAQGGGHEVTASELMQVFVDQRESWSTLIALEKRLFHTVRDKLGLGELVVKRLLEYLQRMQPGQPAEAVM